MFLTLMRKDLRVLRAPIVTAVLIFFFIEVFVGVLSSVADARQLNRINVGYESMYVWRSIALRASYALGLCCAYAAVFAGVGMPIERRERSAEFAAMLPVSRARQTIARLTVVALLVALSIGVHASIIVVANRQLPSMPAKYVHGWRLVENRDVLDALPIAIAMLGLAWLGASVLRSPAITVAIAIGLVLGSYVLVGELAEGNSRDEWYRAFRAALWLVGGVALVGGTVIASRRVEP